SCHEKLIFRQSHQTTCACTTKNHCNSPTSPIADFKFQETPFLKGYQFQPLVGGGEGEQPVHTLKPGDEIGNTPGVKPGKSVIGDEFCTKRNTMQEV
ncbi:hypothetical protein OESDEN_14946, partial [Oesophagostomum dentatum]